MRSKSLISFFMVIVFILGLANLPSIEARFWIKQIIEENRPVVITQNNYFEKPIFIQNSESKKDKEIQTGMAILKASKCGKSATNLKPGDGQETPRLLEFPWLALLVYFDGLTKTPDCDGSLISDRYVLTAAHCIRLENKTLVSVRLGEYNTMEENDCTGNEIKRKCAPPVQEIDVEEAIYHEDYDPTLISFSDDIGLVRLKHKAMFRSNVMPICLPITHPSKVPTKDWMFTAGWNKEKDHKSSLPFKAVVPIIDRKTCKGIHIFIDLNEKHTCVCEDNDVINSYCKGDSGSPIFNTAPYAYGGKPRFVQYGIVSAYVSFCNSILPHLYVNIEPHLPWIAGNIRY